MSFIWPLMLLTLLLLPLLIWLYFRLLRKKQRAVAALGPMGVLQDSAQRTAGKRRHIPPLLFLIALAFLLFGLARPQMIVKLPRIEGTVILAFDVSNSMAADDLQPSRIAAAKEAARAFVQNQPRSIKIGVVAFSNGGLIVQQPTHDPLPVLATIDRLSPQGATSLGHGIFTSLNAIAGEAIALEDFSLEEGAQALQIDEYSSAVVLLLTDGENTGSPEPLDIAQVAAEAGVRVYPVGIGSPEGSVIEIDGFNILTQLDENALQEIAGVTNGRYYYAADEDSLQEVYENIDLQLTVSGEKMEITSILAGIALPFLLAAGALSLLWFGRAP
ncbi:MAG: VWA domain-containing protein [Anaerolineaceae bacterium]|nr:MAG: VWA domain-containing protein [Anaerolineaceae bacterium]